MMGTRLPETCWATIRRERIQKVTSSLFSYPHFKSFRKIIPKYFQLLAPRTFWSHSGFLTRAHVNPIALTLPRFIFIPFSTAHSPRVSRSCNFSVVFHTVMYLCRQIIKIWSIQRVSVNVAHIACDGNDTNFLWVCLIAVSVGPLSMWTFRAIYGALRRTVGPKGAQQLGLSLLAVCPV